MYRSKILSYTLCLAITATASITGWYRAFLPTEISAAADCTGGNIAGAQLHLSEDVASYSLCGVKFTTATIAPTERKFLLAGGTPFGIKLRTDGVLVISVRKDSPADQCGLKSGDVILSVNGVQVTDNGSVSNAVQACKEECRIVFRRGDSESLAICRPQSDGKLLKLGVWVRDSAAGIGTLTFIEPETGIFGGLGHPVSDTDTGDTMPLSEGEITAAEISGAIRGESGCAGELCGIMQADKVIGELTANTEVGIFGTTDMASIYYNENALPAAFRQEVHTGEAHILTTIEGTQPQLYSIEIEHINLCDLSGPRSMVIRITDSELLDATGGIVRGMSGSPIIQDGMLAGAVTHVFLNDPTRGYAVFCETMLEAAE